jgi:DtxR family Mn-dependent transcriptional regulator
MVKLGLLTQHAVHGFSLTDDGRYMADRIISRHYLLERLLVDKLGASWDMADQEADHLQISLSGRLESLLTEQLGNPTTCPHGNPFPGSPNEQELLSAPSITECAAGELVRLVRVTETGEMVPGLLGFCVDQGLGLDQAMTIQAIHANGVEVLLEAESKPVTIPPEFAPYLCVDRG